MSRVRFENGTVINFEGEPSQQDIEEAAQQLTSPIPRRASPFESELSRILFPSIGGTLGGIAGTTFGVAAGGIGAAPGGFVGATTGAGTGEALRQVLAGLTGGHRPRTVLEAVVSPVQQAAIESAGLGIGRAIPMLARTAQRTVVPTIARVGQLVTRVSSDAIRRAIERGPTQVLKKELIQEILPESISEKFIAGIEAFRGQIEKAYQGAVGQILPQVADRRVNLNAISQNFRQRLLNAEIIDQSGKLIKPIFKVATEISRTNTTLHSILGRLQRTRGKFLSVKDAIRMKRELDTLLDFDPNAVRKISKAGQGLLMGLRTSLKEALDDIVPELKPFNDEYHAFRDLYDVVRPKLRDPQIESTIQQLGTRRGAFIFRKLSEINEQIPQDLQFLNEALDALAAQKFAKDPELFAILPLSIAGITGTATRNPALTVLAMLGGAQLASGRTLAAGLRGGERFLTRPAEQIAQRLAPIVPAARQVGPSGISAVLRVLGLQQPE